MEPEDLTQQELKELVAEYQKEFRPVLDNLATLVAQVVIQKDKVALKLLSESVKTLLSEAMERIERDTPIGDPDDFRWRVNLDND
ncbi:MAG: hypothetical protein JRF64_07545 [Deltaproteobacteria bacterium]|jgi:hypothetical protein|nr:hypothetical protein [Deltaproteobacteria bacterium]